MIKEVASTLPVLIILIVCNIGAGLVNSIAVEKFDFDKQRFISGIVKALVAVGSTFALAYAFEVVDLSGLGFTPATIVSTGIIVYTGKLGTNLIKILGLEKVISVGQKDDDETPLG